MSQETGDVAAELRRLMDIAAGEPRRPVTVEAVHRGVTRRRKAVGAAVAATLVLAGSAGVAVGSQRAESGPRPGRPVPGGPSRSFAVPGRAAVPAYYVVRNVIPAIGNTANQQETTVRATATGALRAHVRCPLPGPYVIAWPIAPATHQNFFLVCQRATGPQSTARVLESRIFEFHLTSSGHVAALRPVRGGDVGPVLVRSIAATPDGAEIAVLVYPGSHPPDLHRTPPDVIVINTWDGGRATWRGAQPASAQTIYWPQAISLTADGQKLAFLTSPQCFRPRCTIHGGQQMRVVMHPGSGGGQLNTAGLLVALDSAVRSASAAVMDGLISPDGSTLTLAVMGTLSGPPSPLSVSVVQIPASGLPRVRFIYRLRSADAFSFFSMDPSGSYFLIGTGTGNGPLSGRISHGTLIPLRPDPSLVQDMIW